MTKTLEVVEPRDEEPSAALEVLDESLQGTGLSPGEVAMVAGLVRKAKDPGLALTGPGGLLKSLTKTVLETALEEELSEHKDILGIWPGSGGGESAKFCPQDPLPRRPVP